MGALQANHSSSSISMIKAVVLLSVAALAMGAPEPEAKADPYYGYYGLGHYGYGGLYGGYYGGYGHYYGKRAAEPAPAAKADPYYGVYGLGAHYGYAGYPYVAGAVVYGKRSADPYYGYYGGYGYGHGYGYGGYYGGYGYGHYY